MQRTDTLRVALVASLLGFSVQASAQDDAAMTEPAPEPVAAEPVAAEPAAEAAEDPDKTDPMGWFGIGLKLGVGSVGESEIEIKNDIQTLKIKTESRTGLKLAVPINLGGDGFGWIFEPYLHLDSDINAMGLYNGPTFNIHIMDPLYVGFGFGLQFASLSGDGLEAGYDIGGRIPITATYYLLNDIGLIGEFGFGYTASGYLLEESIVNPDPEINFGSAFAWDFSVGARWP
jgi:hypothetical protein